MSLKLKSVLAALMLTASLTVSSLPASAYAQPAPAAAVSDSADSTPVKVVVKLCGASLLEQVGSEALDTEAAAEAAETVEAQQARVQKQIRSFYPALEVGASYDVLINGFSCMLPKNLIPQVEALTAVESVRLLPEVQVPQMANAPSLSGVPAFQEETGCTGEGQVIAVIDSELCTDHPMFAALPDTVETKLSKTDITEIIGKNVLHRELDPEKTYLSSKLPYVIDYVDDPYEGVSDPLSYHGTHVSGIAAGNEFVTDAGRKVAGIAKDAQIVFMGVSVNRHYIDSEAALQALEDAVVLKADVINMSWGSLVETYGDNIFADVLKAADQAGISICISAGNADNGTQSMNRKNFPESPDVSTIDDKTEKDSCAFVVASADNSISYQRGVLMLGDQQIVFSPFYEYRTGRIDYLTDHLEKGSYEYIDCGELTSEDVLTETPPDYSGKIMLVRRGYLPIDAMETVAEKCSALGLVVINEESFTEGENYPVYGNQALVPTAAVSEAQGALLLAASDKVLKNIGSTVTHKSENKMSFYTSWGMSHSLDLRPDITGIGGNVESAAYDGGTEILSGTSMASPYMAGCTALIRQYLKKQGVKAEGTELLRYIRALMMDTAVPYEENGLLVSPRRQGAGQVSLDRAMQSKVLLTNSEGDGKVNLFDGNGDSFSFAVQLRNLSGKDVTFSDARLCLTTDDTEYYEPYRCDIISGQRELRSTADLSALKSVGAGKAKTVTVRVSLDAAQTASISELFRNGFFIEGYLMLSGAENCPDISVPVCGYYGKWVELPVIREDNAGALVQFGQGMFVPGLPLSEAFPMIQTILSRIPKEEVSPENDFDYFEKVYDYATEEELSRLQFGTQDLWLSPNGDAIADQINQLHFENRRQAKATLQITDGNGKVRYETETELMPPYNNQELMERMHPREVISVEEDMKDYEEGDYTIHVDFRINFAGSQKPAQTLEFPLHIDKTAPQVTDTLVTENGRKILKMDITDNGALDCVFLVGNRSGEEMEEKEEKADSFSAMELYLYYCELRDGNDCPYYKDSDKPVPYVCEMLTGYHKMQDDGIYNYSDMIPLTPDASGICHVEYDVTDLTDYSFTVLDKALNNAEVLSEGGAEMRIKEGLWNDINRGLMEFSGNQVRVADYFDGSVKTYRYSLKDRVLTMTSPDETITRRIFFKNDEDITYYEGDSEESRSMDYYSRYDMPKTLEELPFHAVNELLPVARALLERRTGLTIGKTDASVYVLNAAAFDFYAVGEEERCNTFTVNLATGLSSAFGPEPGMNGTFNLLSEQVDHIKPGIYASTRYDFYVVFNDDNASGMMLGFQTNTLGGLAEFDKIPFTYTVDADKNVELDLDGDKYSAFFTVSPDGIQELNIDNMSYYPLTPMEGLTPADAAQFRFASQVREQCMKYEEAVRHITLSTTDCYVLGVQENGMAMFRSKQGSEYEINPFTLKGTDERGLPIDLNAAPELPEGALSLETLKAQAKANYTARTGRTDIIVDAKVTPDQKVQITFFTDEGDSLGDSYLVEPVPSSVRGDIDCNGSFSIADCVLLARYLAEDAVAVTAQGLMNAETDGDRSALTAGDLSMMLQALAGPVTL